jgi:hypothetical protein
MEERKIIKRGQKTAYGVDSQFVLFHIYCNVNSQDELGIYNWKINICKVLIGFLQGKILLGEPRKRSKNIKRGLKEIKTDSANLFKLH